MYDVAEHPSIRFIKNIPFNKRCGLKVTDAYKGAVQQVYAF